VRGKREELTNLLRVEGSWSPFCMIAKVESLYVWAGLGWLGQWRRSGRGGNEYRIN
jgi:hypothetical protein